MLNEIRIKTWDEFHNEINKIRKNHDNAQGQILYRGLAYASNLLSTTLERISPKRTWSVAEYAKLLKSCSAEIESFTKCHWDFPNDYSWEAEYANNFKLEPSEILRIPFLEFWIYMRHHGFPSPLLDWSASPYISAFFAFEEQRVDAGDNVAIYAYIEPSEYDEFDISVTHKQIRVIGNPKIRSHERHYLQQSWYTLAYMTTRNSKEHTIINYPDFFRPECNDSFIRIEIPYSQRIPALNYLNQHNINHFSLMNSEESLIKRLSSNLFSDNQTNGG